MPKLNGKDVTLIRSANAGDGPDFDKTKDQVLIRTADGKKMIVVRTALVEDKVPAKG